MPPPGAWGSLRLGALGVAIASAGGIAAVTLLRARPASAPRPSSDNIAYRLYALHERPFFIMVALFSMVVWLYARPSASEGEQALTPRRWQRLQPAALWAIAAAVVLLAWIGSYVVLHSLPLSMDEYNAVFQAKIFAAGRITAPLAPEWQPFARGLAPVFVTYYPDQQSWRSGYMPVYSAIRALFSLVGSENLTNPLLGGLTVLVLAGACRRLWPGNNRRVALAVVFLVTSSQFLFNSMSWYSMPAHLLFNLVWLWLYLRNDWVSLAAAPVVGVLALGLHNPFPHALFVAPFLVRMLRRRRFAWLAYMSVVYGAGSLMWFSWLRASYSYLQVNGGMTGTFALPRLLQLGIQAMQLSLVLSWQAPLVGIVAVVALMRWRELGPSERDLSSGLLLTAAFYFLFPVPQGHGWGYRYIYSALGNLIILAAIGADLSAQSVGRVRVARLVAASTLIALLLQWPVRAVQVERFVRPFARATEYAATLPAAVVVVYPDSSYYGRDLVRNDPFLRNSPKILAAPLLGDSGVKRLQMTFGSHVHLIRPAELARLGVPTF
ncbi:MAG: hypothetical protein ACR2M1_03240 [Gemmatimonadaceae bacterium]